MEQKRSTHTFIILFIMSDTEDLALVAYAGPGGGPSTPELPVEQHPPMDKMDRQIGELQAVVQALLQVNRTLQAALEGLASRQVDPTPPAAVPRVVSLKRVVPTPLGGAGTVVPGPPTEGTHHEVAYKLPELIKLPTFDGTGSVTEFLETYADYAEVQQLSEAQRVDLFFHSLSGGAADWYARTTRGNCPTTWQELTTHLTMRYRDRWSAVNAAKSLARIKLGKRERVADFYERVMKLCKEVHPDMAMEDKLVWLGRGLPRAYQDIMAGAKGLTPQELEKRLQNLEGYLRNVRGDDHSDRPKQSSPRRRNRAEDPPQGGVSHRLQVDSTQTGSPAPGTSMGGQTEGVGRRRGPLTCFRCQQMGHIARNCDQRRKKWLPARGRVPDIEVQAGPAPAAGHPKRN